MLWGVLVATKSIDLGGSPTSRQARREPFRSQAPGGVGWWIPRGDIDLQGYSYKPPGKIEKLAGETLCITGLVSVNMRSRIGKYAQPYR